MKIIKRSLLWMLTAAVPVVIAACYGVPANYKTKLGKVVSSGDKQGIKGILVSCEHDDSSDAGVVEDAGVAEDAGVIEDAGFVAPQGELTDENGEFYLDYDETNPCDRIAVKDIDGAENGEFVDTEVAFVNDETEQTIEMDPVH